MMQMSYSAMVDSSVMQKGKPAAAGSKMLENFISPIDATVVTRLEAAGVSIVGRADMDEFGAGGLFDGGGTRCAAALIAENKADFALCNDYTGRISLEAAGQGICYVHPTYGTVSRYGLIPAAASMDQIGIVCKTPEDGFRALKIIAGYDAKDGVMCAEKAKERAAANPENSAKEAKIVEYKPMYEDCIKQVMQILCCAELSNNISRYDGVKFGYRAKQYNGLHELYTKSRTEAFGEDVKLAALLGAMVLSHENYAKYYDKAMRIRRLIKDSLIFEKHGDGSCALRCKHGADSYTSANLLRISRLCGLPSVTTPDCTYVADAEGEGLLEMICLGGAL